MPPATAWGADEKERVEVAAKSSSSHRWVSETREMFALAIEALDVSDQ